MTDPISKTQRWLDLIAFLIGHRFPVSVEQIMEAVPSYARDADSGDPTKAASARRKFERDKDELRDMGIPIKTIPYQIHFGAETLPRYRLERSDFYLPYLNLLARGAVPVEQAGARTLDIQADELGVALNALRRVASLPAFPFLGEARSAFRKLTGDLDPAALESRVLYAGRPDGEATRERLCDLARALQKRKTVRFRYHGMYRGEATDRELNPYGLFFQGGSWYLTGYDLGRQGNRVFRVSRIEGQKPNTASPNTPDYEIPDDFDLTALTGREAWELGSDDEDPVVARVRFSFPLSLWADRNGHGRLVERLPGGGAVHEFDVRQVNPFLRWVLSFEGDAQILTPEDMRAGLRDLASAVLALHEGPSSHGRPTDG